MVGIAIRLCRKKPKNLVVSFRNVDAWFFGGLMISPTERISLTLLARKFCEIEMSEGRIAGGFKGGQVG